MNYAEYATEALNASDDRRLSITEKSRAVEAAKVYAILDLANAIRENK